MALTAADRQNKRDQATRLSVMGISYTEIGKQLGMSRQLTATLVKEELAGRAEHNDQKRESSKAHYREIIRSAWQSYHKVSDKSLNKSGHLNVAIRAQERIDKIDGNDAPKKNEHTGPDGGPIEHSHQAEERDERFERLYAELNSFGTSEDDGDGGGGGGLSMDSHCADPPAA
jgi:hypothetical protein